MNSVSINKRVLGRSLLFALLLLWPLLIFGSPSYMPDSPAYQMGGERAVGFAAQKIGGFLPAEPAQGPPSTATGDDGETKVARSIPYSILAYIFAGPDVSMGYLTVVHALCIAFVFTSLFEAIAGPGLRGYAAMVGVMTFGTGLAPIANYAIPDCFAAIMLGIMMVLPFYWTRFSQPLRITLILIEIGAIAAHASHLPVAVGTAIVATAGLALLRGGRADKRAIAQPILWVPAVLGLLLIVGTGLIGFGTVSIAPKHLPLALARSVENGPARWYLEQECKNPKAYAVCEIYGTDIPPRVMDFLWGERSVVDLATPAQLDRIRSEENTILMRSTLRYPLEQGYFVLRDVPAQFFTFKLDFLSYESEIVRDGKGGLALKNPAMGPVPALLKWLDIVTHFTVLAGVAALGWWWRSMREPERAMVLTLFAGLAVNAAVCALFSGVASRYQARLIWLIPFAAVAIGYARMLRRGQEPNTDRP
ncbi:MAG: hypothetical protein R3E04_02995 [Sphingobium sp.]